MYLSVFKDFEGIVMGLCRKDYIISVFVNDFARIFHLTSTNTRD